jgi:sec-independent protein translocase protein TatA
MAAPSDVPYGDANQGSHDPSAEREFCKEDPNMIPILGEIIGWEALLVLGLIALLFGSSQLPKLARSVGQASRELKKGLHEDPAEEEPKAETDK